MIAVDGNKLVVRLPEGTRELTVPDDFRFTVNGQPLSVQELKPGMKGTADHHDEDDGHAGDRHRGEERRSLFQASGSILLVRNEQGFKQFTEGDAEKRGIKLVKDGVPARSRTTVPAIA